MKQNCQHCGEPIIGNAYRVRSEEAGITLLNMIVCSLCSREARRLRLHTKKMNVISREVSAKARGTYPFTTRYLM